MEVTDQNVLSVLEPLNCQFTYTVFEAFSGKAERSLPASGQHETGLQGLFALFTQLLCCSDQIKPWSTLTHVNQEYKCIRSGCGLFQVSFSTQIICVQDNVTRQGGPGSRNDLLSCPQPPTAESRVPKPQSYCHPPATLSSPKCKGPLTVQAPPNPWLLISPTAVPDH